MAALPSIDAAHDGREAARETGTDDEMVSEDEPPARSALSVRQCPGSPSGAITWQGGNLDSAGAKAVESLRVVATGHDLSQPNKISGRRSSTAEHRFCKPVVGGPNPPAGSMNGSDKLQVSSFKFQVSSFKFQVKGGSCGR